MFLSETGFAKPLLPPILDYMSITTKVLCIDLGGTHCSSALVDREEERVVEESYFRGPVDSNGSRAQILREIQEILNMTLSSNPSKPNKVIVSCPGPFDYENGISRMDGMNKYQAILNFNLRDFFADIIGVAPKSVCFYNDATAFLLGEVYFRKLEQKRIIGLTLGTGLGSSIYVNGRIEDLNYGSAPFQEGIVEDVISTRGMIGHLKEKFGSIPVDNIKDLVQTSGLEEQRRDAFDYLTANLRDFIKQYLAPLAPDLIVIGGSIAKANAFFFDDLQSSLEQNLEVASFDECNLFLGLTFEPLNI